MKSVKIIAPKKRRATLAQLVDIFSVEGWLDVVRHDHLAGRVMLERRPPSEPRSIDFPAELDDPAALYAACWLETEHGLTAPMSLVHQAFEAVAHKQGFDPLVDHLTKRNRPANDPPATES